ncbi:pentatricopeptide repeat-containing protein At2g13600-like [Punica granatum]|uniref:Uncharacterized protein n=2 Tax=Punica granatum TaxID=22663 RepID=A0A218WU94_PUNGR|nr:pentatricopeptide repeat-containing protein At2g13600-like [Punica granatum]OWM75532.1 hypothetical protein CDL15_Pgr021696 [Punica granatum]PKI76404.1 hypothetical protein CRG98_003199 [Punica granatum]
MAIRVFDAVSSTPSKLTRLDHGPENPRTPSNLSFEQLKPTHQVIQSDCSLLNKPINSTTYASVLDSCKCPSLGKQIHAHALKFGFHGHEFVETKLLQMYGRCGCLEGALDLFYEMPHRNLHSWTAVIGVHLDHDLFHDALSLFLELLFSSVVLEFFLFPVALKICSGLGDVELGRQLHGAALKYQFESNFYVGNALIDMYGKCRSLDDAKRVLAKMPQRDHVSWNSIITACIANRMVREGLGYLDEMFSRDSLKPNLVSWSAVIGGFSQNGYDEEAITQLLRMLEGGLRPNARTLASVLPSCARLLKLGLGKEIHGYVTRHGFMSNSYVVNGLVDVYRRCADMGSARKIFSRFSLQNEVSYNTMIVGYCENGDVFKAKELFDVMELVGIEKDTVSWNSMISGYVDNLYFNEALDMYRQLIMEDGVQPDSFTLGSILNACADMASLRRGKEIHSQSVVRGLQSNPFVGGALVEMYCKCQDLDAANLAFHQVKDRDIATWNALISGYSRCYETETIRVLLEEMKRDGFEPNAYTWNSILAGYVENGNHESAMCLLSEMRNSNRRPDIYTVGIIIRACSKLATIERGKQVHAYSIKYGYESDVHIGAALVDMYAKCGNIERAIFSYNRIQSPNLVSQNAMLTAYAMHGLGEEGIALFQRMLGEGYQPDHVTFLTALSCCVHAGAVETGQQLFDVMVNFNVEPTLKHYTCMVDLLSKTGKLHEAHRLIKRMPMEPDAVVWSSLLGGCVMSGNFELGEITAKRLIELEPENTGNHILLANLYAYAGKWSELARTRRAMKDSGMHKSPGCSWIEDRDKVHVFLASDRSHERTEEIYSTLQSLTVHMRRTSEFSIRV